MGFPTALFTAVGTLVISSLIVRLCRFVYLYMRPSSLPRYCHGTDPWALVTGASGGIGKSLAHELAHHGFSVILHGRNPSKLDNVVSTLHQEFPNRSFRTAVLDASSATNNDIAALVSSLSDLHLTILVNNVAGGQVIQPLTSTSAEHVDLSLNTNARSSRASHPPPPPLSSSTSAPQPTTSSPTPPSTAAPKPATKP